MQYRVVIDNNDSVARSALRISRLEVITSGDLPSSRSLSGCCTLVLFGADSFIVVSADFDITDRVICWLLLSQSLLSSTCDSISVYLSQIWLFVVFYSAYLDEDLADL